ncbi:uncharacterized protein E0L32_004268 [Thyridium curvatum]|uniref:Uncharacterized protein n=1 Tax=Thyridium curvatum TaxID=1093900 RepID=A0A507BG93_9PEZI|nr:uncharacterized protein E0L32_004268 [Thyridium curvatum]TPX15570.1 hypothetical protein E0L32_004268 [Thyridium curvatum]
MPALDHPPSLAANDAEADAEVPFPPVTREQILNCSYDSWFPKYRTSCIKSRIIPLSPEFVEYIREDRIILADDDEQTAGGDDDDDWQPSVPSSSSTSHHHQTAPDHPDSASDDEDEEEGDEAPATSQPPNRRFPELHQRIKDEIKALGGAVAPKLNWSSPKDATWISSHQNSIKCASPNDVYLLLKSSSFVSHDLEHAFDGCAPTTTTTASSAAASGTGPLGYDPVLVLRSFFHPHPALEFRCFVKHRSLVAVTQRDLNHYPFLDALRPAVVARVRELFDGRLRFTFPDPSFAFDVYIPGANGDDDTGGSFRLSRARLIDINPWAPRTDTLLFGWPELLDVRVPRPILGGLGSSGTAHLGAAPPSSAEDDEMTTTDDDDDDDEADEYVPELRLVEKDDPAAYNFNSSQYSAHKLPKDVVDASLAGEGGLREFVQQWQEVVGGGREPPAAE